MWSIRRDRRVEWIWYYICRSSSHRSEGSRESSVVLDSHNYSDSVLDCSKNWYSWIISIIVGLIGWLGVLILGGSSGWSSSRRSPCWIRLRRSMISRIRRYWKDWMFLIKTSIVYSDNRSNKRKTMNSWMISMISPVMFSRWPITTRHCRVH